MQTKIVNSGRWGRGGSPTGVLTSLACVLLAAVICLTGCKALKPGPVVPEYPTAREQAQNASRQYDRARQTIGEETRKEEFKLAAAGLKMVTQRFPNDRVYTPPSTNLLAKCYVEMGDLQKAQDTYMQVIREYSDIPDVHAEALFGMAELQSLRRRPREEKEYYRQLIDTYADSDNPQIQTWVNIARRRYAIIE